MKKEIHRKKIVNINDRQNKANKACVKMPSTVKPVKKKVDLKKEIPAIILLVLFIFWSVGSVFGIIAYQHNKGISASADGYNSTNYTYANYFNPFTSRFSGQGFVESSTVNSVTVGGTIKYTYRSCNFLLDDFQIGDTITISANWVNTGTNVGAIRVMYTEPNGLAPLVLTGGSTSGNYYTATVVDSPTSTSKLCLALYYNYNSSDYADMQPIEYSNIMVSRNISAPFVPNLNAVAEQARQEGYAQGEEDGYEQGRIDGLQKGNVSFLVGAKAKATYALNANFEYETAYYESSANGGTVSFDRLYNALPGGTYSYLNVTIDFASPVYGRNLFLNAYGNRGIFYDGNEAKVFTAIMEDGQRINARFVYNESEENYGLELQISSFDFYLVRLESVPVVTRSNLDTFYLRVPNSSYREGYNDGYNVGVKDNSTLQEQYELGVSQGFSQGKVVGYNKGIEDANTYSFTNLLGSVFDVPIKAFNGLLDFEVLGVNLRGFYLSILTACLVLAIIRLFI